MTHKALVLLSGGLDSTTVLAKVSREYDDIYTVSFRYGQRHADKELAASVNVADHYGAEHTVIDVPVFKSDSVLMTDAEMPQLTYEEISASEGVSPTYVPYRNGTFLSVATGYALQNEIGTIFAGVHAEDARGWAYPDCTPEFIGAMANAIHVGTYFKVRLLAPLQYLLKHEVVRLGASLNAPYFLTYSCYEGTSPSCGRCPTCISRLEAFYANELRDPIEYAFDKYGGPDSALARGATLGTGTTYSPKDGSATA